MHRVDKTSEHCNTRLMMLVCDLTNVIESDMNCGDADRISVVNRSVIWWLDITVHNETINITAVSVR